MDSMKRLGGMLRDSKGFLTVKLAPYYDWYFNRGVVGLDYATFRYLYMFLYVYVYISFYACIHVFLTLE